ncbi:MAG: alanine racemase [Mogibacterium sp.]|nr:alanine racemase [Mogibacterium sp.]
MSKYPLLTVNHEALRSNMTQVVSWCRNARIDVAGVIKVSSGMESFALDYEQCGAKWIASSRLEQLARAKAAGVKVPLMMIRVPMPSEIPEMIEICDYSLESEFATIKAIEEEAAKSGKEHKVILMADLGDLREGFFEPEELVDVAKYVEDSCDFVHLAGIGTNLGCYGSVMPTKEKMDQLASYADAVEDAIGRPLEIVSGGATSSLMPLFDGVMPDKINMLRIGAIVACGPLEDLRLSYGRTEVDVMRDDCFTLEAEVIEVKKKPTHPIGELGVNAFGEKAVYTDRGDRKRAILAIGRADYGDIGDILPQLEGSEVTMASGDHTILDIEDCKEDIRVGDTVRFSLKYSAILRLTASENVTIEEKNI